MAVGCDGCPVNTGTKNGVIRHLEKESGKSFHWFICQLHANELILRHLFEHYDGRKTGPSSYAGPISKKILDCEKLAVINFDPVELGTDLPLCAPSDLSTDQEYLMEICKAVASGQCSDELANRKPGKLGHARWLTTGCRLLRLYVGTPKPNRQLKNLVELIMKVYAPVWFAIKSNSQCYMGAQHVFLTVKLSRCLEEEVRRVIDPVIQRNAYFAHCENLLLCMMTDEDVEVRIKALNTILECRKSPKEDLREFELPSINFAATSYPELIEWNNITEPPVIAHLTNEEIADLIMTDFYTLKKLLHYPCHTQAVERHIKLMTEACNSVVGPAARDARVKSVLISRAAMPSLVKKADWNVPDFGE